MGLSSIFPPYPCIQSSSSDIYVMSLMWQALCWVLEIQRQRRYIHSPWGASEFTNECSMSNQSSCLKISWIISIFSILSWKPCSPFDGDPLCALYLGQHYTLSVMVRWVSFLWTSCQILWQKRLHCFHFCISFALRECVFRRNALNGESQGWCLSYPFLFNVLPKLGQKHDFRRNCLVKETLKPIEGCVGRAPLCLLLVLDVKPLSALSTKLSHIYCVKMVIRYS